MNFPRSQKGFSLVEALLVLAITSIMGVAVMQTMRDSTNSMAFSEAKFEEQELVRQIQGNLIYKPACETNLRDKVIGNVTASDIAQVVNAGGHMIFEKGQIVGNQSLKIKDFEFVISQAALDDLNTFRATASPASPFHMLEAEFRITTEKLKTTLGAKEAVRVIPIRVKVDATSAIKECFSSTDAATFTAMNDFCRQMGGALNTTTNLCEFSQSCASTTGAQMIPARCVDEKITEMVAELNKTIAELATRAPATVVAAATPVASPTPSTIDPYTLPFSRANPGKGCSGVGCAASDFGPCNGVACTTNGGSCTGQACRTGVVTGVVKWDGVNPYTPSNPGPGCKEVGCHASDYGPCNGVSCTTNGGSCTGQACRTGVNN